MDTEKPQNEARDSIGKKPQNEAFDTPETPFHVKLREAREAAGLQQIDASELLGKSRATYQRWEGGLVVPAGPVQRFALAMLTSPAARPTYRRRLAMADRHGLHWQQSKGWVLRLTLVLNGKQVGKRLKRSMRTRNADEACARRDVVVAFAESLGLTVCQRRQKPRKS